MTTIIIEKEGRQLMELASHDNGICAIVKRCANNGIVETVISADEFASILDRADDNGCDIFDYYD